MDNVKIDLKLKDNKLYWTTDKGNSWGKVDGTYPIIGADENYKMAWEAFDDSIYGIEIHFNGDAICKNTDVKGNGTRKITVKSKSKIGTSPCKQTYTIKIIKEAGDSPKEYDPEIEYPKASAPQ